MGKGNNIEFKCWALLNKKSNSYAYAFYKDL